MIRLLRFLRRSIILFFVLIIDVSSMSHSCVMNGIQFPQRLPVIKGYKVEREVGSGSFGKAYLVRKENDPERRA